MRSSSAGFGAIMANTINVCEYHLVKYKNTDIFIDVEEINELFIQKNSPENNQDLTIDIESEFMFDIFNKIYDVKTDAHRICNGSLVSQKNKIYELFFELKNLELYQSRIKEYLNDKTLSIHIRGTDKHTEIGTIDLVKLEKKILKFISENEIDNIFLCTDDQNHVDFIQKKFGYLNISSTEKIISKDGRPIHFDLYNRKELNKQVMLDIFLLSQSKYFMYSFSNVSYLALIIGIKNFVKIDCINV